MTKQILTEVILPDARPLVAEADTEGGFYRLRGLFLEGETTNHNGRSYPREEVEKAVSMLNERIQTHGPVPGELDHPEGLNVNFDRISHLITDMKMEGNNGMGTMKVIKAGLGLIVEGCIAAGMQVGVSSRGSGNINHDGRVSDFDIVTVDIVANPSAPNAYPQISLAESITNNVHGREAWYLTDYVKTDAAAQKYFEQEITKCLTDIRDQYKWRN